MPDTPDKIGRGVFWSIRKRADTEISDHMAKNRSVRLHRHALWQRVLRFLIDRRFRTFIVAYGVAQRQPNRKRSRGIEPKFGR